MSSMFHFFQQKWLLPISITFLCGCPRFNIDRNKLKIIKSQFGRRTTSFFLSDSQFSLSILICTDIVPSEQKWQSSNNWKQVNRISIWRKIHGTPYNGLNLKNGNFIFSTLSCELQHYLFILIFNVIVTFNFSNWCLF